MMLTLATVINGHWVHDLPRFVPLLPHTDQIGVRYYGLAYVLGFVGAAWLLSLYAKKGRSLVPASEVMDFMFYIMIGVFVGGRLGWFLLYHPELLTTRPLSIFAVWEGGMASHGGFVGVGLALWFYARRRKVPFLHLSDLVVSTAPMGLLFGRIANFINGELWGKKSNIPWAVIFPDSAPVGVALSEIPPRHPSQLYEAFLEGALLLLIFQWRFWRSRWVRQNPGRISGEFLIAYAIVRAIGEVFREPDAELILGLSRGTFYSIFLVGGGLLLIVLRRPPLVLPKVESEIRPSS
jgi:phosphatidylglycerol---prolipoprotein diacylglyceryl transferase